MGMASFNHFELWQSDHQYEDNDTQVLARNVNLSRVQSPKYQSKSNLRKFRSYLPLYRNGKKVNVKSKPYKTIQQQQSIS